MHTQTHATTSVPNVWNSDKEFYRHLLDIEAKHGVDISEIDARDYKSGRTAFNPKTLRFETVQNLIKKAYDAGAQEAMTKIAGNYRFPKLPDLGKDLPGTAFVFGKKVPPMQAGASAISKPKIKPVGNQSASANKYWTRDATIGKHKINPGETWGQFKERTGTV